MIELDALNALDRAAFVRELGAVFEHSPWVAEGAYAWLPFASVEALHRAMCEVVAGAGEDEQLALIRAHPQLANVKWADDVRVVERDRRPHVEPSDGVERAVANHLAVRYGTLPPGTIKGVVKERNVETGPSIDGAIVTMDDGRTATFEGEELWVFDVAPCWVCVTATAEGYHPGSTCRQARSGEEVYASIALFPNSDFIDGGPGDADAGREPIDPDAGGRIDAGPAATSPDAGSTSPDRRSGGCAAARGASGASLVGLALLASLLWPRRARRAASRSR